MPQPPHARLTLDRIVALSDGVIAIVLTILVLGIEVPENADFSPSGLLRLLETMGHDIFIYSVSFVVIGGYWIQHHVIFHYPRYGNRKLAWLNLLFLLLLSLIPFTTQLKSAYRAEPLVVVVMGVLHLLVWLMLGAISWSISRSRDLMPAPIAPEVMRQLRIRAVVGFAICLATIGAAFVSAHLAPGVLLALPLLALSNPTADSHWELEGEAS
jgi:uncharacterized membrane protein